MYTSWAIFDYFIFVLNMQSISQIIKTSYWTYSVSDSEFVHNFHFAKNFF